MKMSLQMVIGLTASVLSFTGFHMNSASQSGERSGGEKKVFFPLVDGWKSLPGDERQRFSHVVGVYGSSSRDMQHGGSENLVTWTMPDTADCSSGREHYRKYRSLPPNDRRALINKWKKKHLG